MNFENDLDQDPTSYDDDHDSDLEARLYAEIHFSNNIIGEENNSTTNNQQANPSSFVSNKIDNNGTTEKVVNQTVQTQNIATNDTLHSSIATTFSDRIQNDNTTNETNKTPQKRSTHNDSAELNKSNKKRKSGNINESESSRPVKEHFPPADSNKIINPYNKNVSHTSTVGMPLLSPEFINLLFKNYAKKKMQTLGKHAKKNKNVKVTGNKVYQQNKIETNPSRIVVEKEPINTNMQLDNGIQQNDLSESSIIDISSEDSTEDDSKYNTTVATDKKLGEKKALVAESEESLSDSEESIFEVPVPPKPAPPVIELKDSGSEVDSGSENDNDSSSNDSSSLQQNITENEGDKSFSTTTADTDNECHTNSTVNEPDNIVLNCTEIQKGVCSLSEIKQMSQSSSKKELSSNIRNNAQDIQLQQSSINMCKTKEPENQQKQSNNSVNKEKVANTLNKKQSDSCPQSKTLSQEEYFFQPMNDKMKAFYNESWGGENFDMDELKNKMSSDPNKWAILNDDIVASFTKRKRYFGMVCSRCHKDGHRQNQCTEIRKLPTCHMCGLTGHIEVSCPKKMCLTCGEKQNMYRKTCENCRKMFCSRCRSRGHMAHACPDLWRRYHQTINKSNAEPPDNLRVVIKSRNELQCCNCAKKGHVSAVCNKLRWSQHFPNPEHVTNYNGPPYDQDDDLSRNANEVESSINASSICDSSFDINSTVDTATNLDSTCEASFRNQSLMTSPATTTREPRKAMIFEVKPKMSHEGVSLKTSTLVLDMRYKNASNNYGNWTYLEHFLNSLVVFTPAQFVMNQCGKQAKIRMTCLKKYKKLITQLIQQYASRNNNERSYMLMTCERRIHNVARNLREKFNELNNLNEDLVQLYEESRRLNWEIMNKENRVSDSHEYLLKVGRLAVCQRKLLMTLYREGFLDDSLKKLRNIYKILTSTKQYIKKPHKSMAFKDFFSYLHYFNNVFSPHEHTELKIAMQKFQEHLARCDRLKNNPLLFPQIDNGLVDDSNQHMSSSTHLAALEAPSTSYIPPLLPNYSPAANRFQGYRKAGQETMQQRSAEHLKYLKKHPRGLFLESVESKKKGPKSKLTKKLNNFREETKRLINTAKELNLPHLHKHIDILQKKMQNEIYVYEKDVKLLQQHVNEELKRRGERRKY